MKKLNAFYFSGTGNTRYVAHYLAQKLNTAFETQVFDISQNQDFASRLTEADVVLLAFPIYGSVPPIPMRQFVTRYGEQLRGKTVAIAETQYFFSGDGAASLGRALELMGADVAYAEHFNMPNNIADSGFFKVRNGREVDEILKKANARMDSFCDKIIRCKRFRRGFNVFSHAIGYYGQRKWWRRHEADKRSRLKIDASKCVSCGACVKNCPVSNLSITDGKVRTNGRCVFCYRCINACGVDAITLFGSKVITKYKGIDKAKQ